jgi:hypothetical protein
MERRAVTRDHAFIPNRLRPWIDARQRWKLSHLHVQMARAPGMNPKMFGKLANHRQQRWKRPLPEFIAHLYIKRFGMVPDVVKTIEEIAAADMEKRRVRKMRKLASTSAACDEPAARQD